MMTPSLTCHWASSWGHGDSSTGHTAEQQSFTTPPLLTAFSYGKTWQQPLDTDPMCHSEVNRQIIHQWDCVPPKLPLPLLLPLNQQRQLKCAVASQWRTLKQNTLNWFHLGLLLVIGQVFKGLTLLISNSFNMYHIAYGFHRTLSEMITCVRHNHLLMDTLSHFCFYIQ